LTLVGLVPGFFEIVLHEIFVLKIHVFNRKFDFWSFLTLLFHCLVVLETPDGLEGWFLVVICNGMEGGWIVVGLFSIVQVVKFF
jgi:hypothetical protein